MAASGLAEAKEPRLGEGGGLYELIADRRDRARIASTVQHSGGLQVDEVVHADLSASARQ